MEQYKNMTNEELFMALVEKFGKDWDLKTVDPDDPLVCEFANRISCGF